MIVLVTFIKPVPINQKLKRGKGNRLYLSEEYSNCWNLISMDFRKQYNGIQIIGNVNVEIIHSYKRYDVDAISKSVLDVLQGIVYQNDRQVISYSVKKDLYAKKELLIVRVNEL